MSGVQEARVVENTLVVSDNDSKIASMIREFELNANGIIVRLSNVGASITSIRMPNFSLNKDDGDAVDDVVLGFKSAVEMYKSRNPFYLAVIVGRVANRIGKGRFSIDGEDFMVATNNGPNHLHGGEDGFSHRIWDAQMVDKSSVQFTLLSKDGDQGYPGTVQVTASYSLVTKGENGAALKLQIQAKLLDGKASPINLAQHTYFNLAGHNSLNGILDHKLTMPSVSYTPVDPTSIPTREVRLLDNDPAMDWRSGRIIRDALVHYGCEKAGLSKTEVESHFSISRSASNLAVAGDNCSNPNEPFGFDHNYVVLNTSQDSLNLVGTVEHEHSRRRLSVFTDAPGVQLYTANWLDGANSDICKDGASYCQWQGLCLETQTFPDGILVDSSEKKFAEFAQGKCFILRSGGPDYIHRVEYHFEPMS